MIELQELKRSTRENHHKRARHGAAGRATRYPLSAEEYRRREMRDRAFKHKIKLFIVGLGSFLSLLLIYCLWRVHSIQRHTNSLQQTVNYRIFSYEEVQAIDRAQQDVVDVESSDLDDS
ncbi:hypothetical protein TKK_0010996 [Trichogramma kaykai]